MLREGRSMNNDLVHIETKSMHVFKKNKIKENLHHQ